MSVTPARLFMPEHQARRIALVQAIDTVDTGSRLVSAAQRSEVESAALGDTARVPQLDDDARIRLFLDTYASGMLNALVQQPAGRALATLQTGRIWDRWVAVGVPALALAMGVLTDQVANPHRVDLLAVPLLAVVFWNMAVYVALATALVAGRILARRPNQTPASPALGGLRQWASNSALRLQRASALQSRIAAYFHTCWLPATAALDSQRLKRVLHLSAATWALGLMLSLLSRGLVVEYRAGWESTFLDAGQVLAFLNVLFSPVISLLPIAPFTLEEVTRLRFDSSVAAALPGSGKRWAWLYAGLFLMTVVLPRLALAATAWRRIALRSKVVAVELDCPYFQRLVAEVMPVRVRLGLLTFRDSDRAAMLRLLLDGQTSDNLPQQVGDWSLISTARGDEMVLREVRVGAPGLPVESAPLTSLAGWAANVRARLRPGSAAADGAPRATAAIPSAPLPDMVFVSIADEADLAAAAPFLSALPSPLLLMLLTGSLPMAKVEPLRRACLAFGHGRAAGATVVDFESFTGSWHSDAALLALIKGLLPASQQPGFSRITLAWAACNHNRLISSLQAIAGHMLLAARQLEEVSQPGLRVRAWGTEERRVHAALIDKARTDIARRAQASAAALYDTLCKLHGVNPEQSAHLSRKLGEDNFSPHSPASPRVLMGGAGAAAGAAAGATVGAHVDLATLGATLGAGAALGALLGGGAALAASVWRDKTSASGALAVQFSDEMLLAMLESCLLRYLAVCRLARSASPSLNAKLLAGDNLRVAAEVRRMAVALTAHWQAARADRQSGFSSAEALCRTLEAVVGRTFVAPYPGGMSSSVGLPGSALKADEASASAARFFKP